MKRAYTRVKRSSDFKLKLFWMFSFLILLSVFINSCNPADL